MNNTYYINSLSNRQAGKDYDGYFGVMLPEITEIQIEQGKLKWKAVNLENYTVNNILDTENYKRRVMYKIIIGENIYYVEQENNALDYMIFEDFDNLPSGTFEITIQAYIYWKSSLETLTDLNVTITNNIASDYFALLGESGTTETGLISKASAITADEYVLNGIYVENGMLIWDFVKEYDGYEIVKTHTQYIVTYANATEYEFSSGLLSSKAEFTSTDLYAKWWSETMTENTDYNIKIRVFGDNEYLNSNYVTYADVSGESETRVVSNLGFASMLVGNKIYPFGDENHNNSIKIELDRVVLGNLSNTYNYGFEIRYRAIGSEDEWETYDYGYVSMQNDANPDVATYVLDISQLSKTSFEYQIRLTLRDENNTKWLKSNWSEKDNFNVPTSIEKIYYDENRQEIYFADEIIPDSEKYYGYIITDEILNENHELIETRKYLVKAGIHSGEKYCVVKDGVNYIYYSPTVLGNHRISVRKTPDLQGALVSTACYYKSENETGEYTVVTFDLFTCGGEGEHGSVANPYLIENEEDFKNLAYRAYKYDYLKNVNIDGNDVDVDASYYFKQTKDISLTETINGQLSTYFDGNYDGNNFELTYGLTDNGSASLFGTIEKNGVFRNTFLNVKFTPSSSNISLASVAQINEGNIVNNVLNSFDITSSAGTITYAGFVVNNKGTLQKLVANANLEVSNVLKASGIASENTGTISQCGNNGNISLTNERSNAVSGIVNSNYKDVIECYNKGSLTINSKAGVVSVGGIVAGNDSDTTIIDCYNTGVLEITSINHNTMLLGGIVASSTGNNIENCYVTQQIVSPTGSKYSYGAIVGYFGVAPVERNNYYLSGSTYAIGNNSSTIFATAKTESEMKNTGFFEMLNKDAFVAGKTSINKGYPVLIWENEEDLLFNKVG